MADNMKLDDACWNDISEIYGQNQNCRIDDELVQLCKDLFSRKYRCSLYKSLAEFDLLFEEIPHEQRTAFKSYMMGKVDDNMYVTDGKTAGFLRSEYVEKLRARANEKLKNLEDVVFVDAAYLFKRLNPDQTLIVINNFTASLSEVPLLSNEAAAENSSRYYFYLYFKTKSTSSKAIAEETSALKEVIKADALENFIGETHSTK